jgi:hypothetical protein
MNSCKTRGYSQYSDIVVLSEVACDIAISSKSGDYSTQINFSKSQTKTASLNSTQSCFPIIDWLNCNEANKVYNYQIALSLNEYSFTIAHYSRYNFWHDYKFPYSTEKNKKCNFFLRKKSVVRCITKFDEIKSSELRNSEEIKINIYPETLDGVVGIKFVNIFSDKF